MPEQWVPKVPEAVAFWKAHGPAKNAADVFRLQLPQSDNPMLALQGFKILAGEWPHNEKQLTAAFIHARGPLRGAYTYLLSQSLSRDKNRPDAANPILQAVDAAKNNEELIWLLAGSDAFGSGNPDEMIKFKHHILSRSLQLDQHDEGAAILARALTQYAK